MINNMHLLEMNSRRGNPSTGSMAGRCHRLMSHMCCCVFPNMFVCLFVFVRVKSWSDQIFDVAARWSHAHEYSKQCSR